MSLAIPRLIFWDITVLVVPSTNETVSMCGHSPFYEKSVELQVYKYFLTFLLCSGIGIISVMYSLIMKRITTSRKNLKKYGANVDASCENVSNTETVSVSTRRDTETMNDNEMTEDTKERNERHRNVKEAKAAKEKITLEQRLCFIFLCFIFYSLPTLLPF